MIAFETALRLTEVMLALALGQQALEHLAGPARDRWLFGLRLVLCFLLIVGLARAETIWALWLSALVVLIRFEGPYNGGADRMGLLILTCLALAHLAPNPGLAELALGYVAVQLVLSYAISGWVKLVNPKWRSGQALCDVFAYSAYPVSDNLRSWAERPRAMWAASWAVIGFEVAFPLAVLHPLTLIPALVITAAFHGSNACVFGLNRFFWTWLCAYPSLLWLQGRILPV